MPPAREQFFPHHLVRYRLAAMEFRLRPIGVGVDLDGIPLEKPIESCFGWNSFTTVQGSEPI